MTESLVNSRILIIDDEIRNVELLEDVLSAEGFTQLTSTTEPDRAMALIDTVTPDLLLLDLRMPGTDGYAILSRLQPRQRAGEYLPVVVLTADAARDARHRALALGAHDFLTKPFDITEVILRVWNLLETRALYKRLRELTGQLPKAEQRPWQTESVS